VYHPCLRLGTLLHRRRHRVIGRAFSPSPMHVARCFRSPCRPTLQSVFAFFGAGPDGSHGGSSRHRRHAWHGRGPDRYGDRPMPAMRTMLARPAPLTTVRFIDGIGAHTLGRCHERVRLQYVGQLALGAWVIRSGAISREIWAIWLSATQGPGTPRPTGVPECALQPRRRPKQPGGVLPAWSQAQIECMRR